MKLNVFDLFDHQQGDDDQIDLFWSSTEWWWSNRSKTFSFINLTAFYHKFNILLLPAKCIY